MDSHEPETLPRACVMTVPDEPCGPPVCPVCGGPTVPLRSVLRCLRCAFVICQACDGDLGEG
jgi:hypothetical protein